MKFIISMLLLLAVHHHSYAQTKSKETTVVSFNVSGNCGMCKSRIEEAAYIKGVKEAVWDKENHRIQVAFKPAKTDLAKIRKSILDAGHDVDSMQATDAAYKKLPECCQYRSQTCNH